MTRLYNLSFLVLLLGILTYSIIEWQTSSVEHADAIDSDLTPDFIAEALKSDIYNTEGKLSHVIEAERMEHYTELAFSHFEFPNYTLYPKNNSSPWKVSAKEGTLYDNNRVILKNRVRLTATDENSLIQEIHCKYLELDLNTNILSSEQTILIQGKDFTMYGSGLIIDLNTTQMTLTEHVQTIYKKTNS